MSRVPFSLTTAAGSQKSALRTADREPMGALCGVCRLASGRNRAEDSQQPPACFCTRRLPDGRNNLQETAKNSRMRQPGQKLRNEKKVFCFQQKAFFESGVPRLSKFFSRESFGKKKRRDHASKFFLLPWR